MIKRKRGGKRGAGGAASPDPMKTSSTIFEAFQKMSDDDKADAISKAISQGVPAHLSDTAYQKFVYNTQMNDRPVLVDDATLAKMPGKTLYRTVNAVYDSKNDIGYSADDICKQVQSGRITRTSDNGGSVYGRGIYFANDKNDSTVYGSTRGNIKKTAVISGKLNNNAHVITYSRALTGLNIEIGRGSKLGRTLSRIDKASAVSIYAVSKGYNVISNGSTYMNVLNRNAVTMSKTISAK